MDLDEELHKISQIGKVISQAIMLLELENLELGGHVRRNNVHDDLVSLRPFIDELYQQRLKEIQT